MTNKDEETQNQFEQNHPASDRIDAYAYKKVFDVLKQEPDFQLPANFADRIMARLEARRESSKDFVWLGIGIFSFVIAGVVAVVLTGFSLNFGAFKFITGYPGLIVFGIAFVLALQWVDKKVVRKNMADG